MWPHPNAIQTRDQPRTGHLRGPTPSPSTRPAERAAHQPQQHTTYATPPECPASAPTRRHAAPPATRHGRVGPGGNWGRGVHRVWGRGRVEICPTRSKKTYTGQGAERGWASVPPRAVTVQETETPSRSEEHTSEL